MAISIMAWTTTLFLRVQRSLPAVASLQVNSRRTLPKWVTCRADVNKKAA